MSASVPYRSSAPGAHACLFAAAPARLRAITGGAAADAVAIRGDDVWVRFVDAREDAKVLRVACVRVGSERDVVVGRFRGRMLYVPDPPPDLSREPGTDDGASAEDAASADEAVVRRLFTEFLDALAAGGETRLGAVVSPDFAFGRPDALRFFPPPTDPSRVHSHGRPPEPARLTRAEFFARVVPLVVSRHPREIVDVIAAEEGAFVVTRGRDGEGMRDARDVSFVRATSRMLVSVETYFDEP